LFLLISRIRRLGIDENVAEERVDNLHDYRSSEVRECGPVRRGVFGSVSYR
jgi:hypothetical protein